MSKIAALAAILAGLVWGAAAVLSWGDSGLGDTSTLIWWAGVGLIALSTGLIGYEAARKSPVWLRLICLFGAAALGASILSSVDVDLKQAPTIVVGLGAVALVVGLIGLFVSPRKSGADEPDAPVHGRRAAR